MKKFYFLFIFCCLGIGAVAQTTYDTIYAVGSTSSYKTGNVTTTTRASGNIISTDSTQRGWGVFDLSAIPAATLIKSCVIGFNVAAYGGSGTPSGWHTYGFSGDLSTVDTPSVLFADCISGTLLSTGSYDTSTGNKKIPTTTASQAFMTAHDGDTVSLCWTGGGTRIYTITGVSGTDSGTGTHAPYIALTYCTGVSSVTATASATSLCKGSSLTLTGAGTGITSYSWTGPNGYTSTLESPTIASDTSSGIYTFTGYNSGGCATSVTTASVTVSSSPSPMVGPGSLCLGSSVTFFEPVTEGTWTTSPASVATVSSSGVVTGVATGTVAVTYACGTHTVNQNVTVNGLPSAILGVDTICEGGVAILSDTSGSGFWSSSPTSVATVNSSGFVVGLAGGTATITFTKVSTNCSATHILIVNPPPSAITGTLSECLGLTTTLSDTVLGGVWSSANPSVASIDSFSGVVTGLAVGGVYISYSTVCGSITTVNTVKSLPGPIVGRDSVCLADSSMFSDDIAGGMWSSNDMSIATVPSSISGSAEVYGLSIGVTTITYTLNTGCYRTSPFTVAAYPDTIITRPPPITACVGEPYDLVDMTPGGIWSSDDTSKAIISTSGLLKGVHSGTVTINYKTPPGCSISTVIQVSNLPPHILGGKTLCPGAFDTLTDATLGGTWNTSNASIATVSSSGVVNTISGGSVYISYTAPTGCAAVDTEKVYPRPTPSITYNWVEGTFSADTAGYIGYQWYTGSSLTDTTILTGATSYHLAALYNEYYFVVVTDTLGCSGTSAPYVLVNVGVKNINNIEAISIYPNPATSTLYISTTLILHAVISDVKGKTIIVQKGLKQIDISNLSPGIYTISFYDDNEQKVDVRKFIKE